MNGMKYYIVLYVCILYIYNHIYIYIHIIIYNHIYIIYRQHCEISQTHCFLALNSKHVGKQCPANLVKLGMLAVAKATTIGI